MKKYLLISAALIVLGAGFSAYLISGENSESLKRIQSVSKTPTPNPGDDKIDHPTSDPYTGDLARFDRENRAENLQIQRVMDILGIKEGSYVADIGAGGGWFSVIAAKRVGERGKVFAVDINKDSQDYIDRRAEKENLTNIETVLSKTDDPLLPEATIESVLILNTYHEFSAPVTLMRNLRKSLKNGALIGIIDRNGKGDDHGLDSGKVVADVEKAGFVFKDTYDFVEAGKMDYFLVFGIESAKK